MNEAVISGFNVISPLGIGREAFAEGMLNGRSGIVSLEGIFDLPNFPVGCAALIPKEIFPSIALNDFAGEVAAQLQVLFNPDPLNSREIDGLIYGTAQGIAKFSDISKFHSGGVPAGENLRADYGINWILRRLEQIGHPRIAPHNIICLANGCVTGLAAIMYAVQRVRRGLNKRVLVVCDETRVRPEELLKYNALGALTRERDPAKASRPFSIGRAGFVKGEGAGLVIVEERESAEKSGAQISASVIGYRLTSDAWRLTDGREDLKGMCAAMKQALDMAKISPQQIDYINAHGTSTPNNDHLETLGIKQVFGQDAYKIPVSSLKSQVGHLNFACGIVELIGCLVMLEKQRVAPTINYEPDPLCDLYYVPERSEARPLRYILKNSFGFGGANAAMILRR